jgi:hypothetical protein
MDSYLTKRKKKPTSSKQKPKKEETEAEFVEEEQEFFSKDKSLVQKFLDFISGEQTDEYEEFETEEPMQMEVDSPDDLESVEDTEYQEEVAQKKGIIEKIKSWLYLDNNNDEEIYEEDEEIVDSDVEDEIKEVLKIQNKWLSRLPNRKIREFKESKDYERYKEILEKYNLIRKD